MKIKRHLIVLVLLSASISEVFSQPIFTTQPTDQSVSLGANVQFVSKATTTTGPLTYQWQFATKNISAQTNASLSLTNIQLINAGDYDVVATDNSLSATSHVAHLEVDPTFTKITSGTIVTDATILGYSCAWGDYDNDGYIDLVVMAAFNTVANTPSRNSLFHNNRDGTFTKVSNTVITTEFRDWRGCAWADYDNDGNLDLYVTSTDGFGFAAQNELFRNNGNGTFTKMTPSNVGPIASPAAGASEGCVWADYDNDGFLDLFVARFGPD